jgi:hypothetical protein
MSALSNILGNIFKKPLFKGEAPIESIFPSKTTLRGLFTTFPPKYPTFLKRNGYLIFDKPYAPKLTLPRPLPIPTIYKKKVYYDPKYGYYSGRM